MAPHAVTKQAVEDASPADTARETASAPTAKSSVPTNPAPAAGGLAAKLRKKRGSANADQGQAGRSHRNQTTVPVRTADKQWWFRTHRDPAMQVPVDLLVVTSGKDEGTYFLDPEVEFPDELDQYIVPAILTRAITHDGMEFFFLAKQSDRSPKQSTRRIVNEARNAWIKMRWNATSKGYDFEYARQLRREPEWSDKSLDELLEMAFGDNYITRVDHEVVNRLIFPDDYDYADAEPAEGN